MLLKFYSPGEKDVGKSWHTYTLNNEAYIDLFLFFPIQIHDTQKKPLQLNVMPSLKFYKYKLHFPQKMQHISGEHVQHKGPLLSTKIMILNLKCSHVREE